jgi:hypothetical protein
MHRLIAVFFLTIAFSLAAADKPKGKFGDSLKPFVENFKGRGALTDGSKPSTPAEGIKKLWETQFSLCLSDVGVQDIC